MIGNCDRCGTDVRMRDLRGTPTLVGAVVQLTAKCTYCDTTLRMRTSKRAWQNMREREHPGPDPQMVGDAVGFFRRILGDVEHVADIVEWREFA